MRRSLFALTWAIGTTMAVVLAWYGVSIGGDQVVSGRDTPVQEAIDVAPATLAPLPEGPRRDGLSSDDLESITANLDAATTTTTLPPDIVTTPGSTPDTPATTTPARGPTPATRPDPVDAAGAPPATTADTSPPTTAAPPPPTTPPATTAEEAPATAPTTAPAHSSGTVPPGGSDNAALTPVYEGTQTFRFDCGSVTIHWRNYRMRRVTGDLDEGDVSCVEQFGGVTIEVLSDLAAGETVFLVHYPDGGTDEYRMPIQTPPEG